ncbi:P-loop containing nucleoside triphosphate hydrolase protein [Mycena pura]|uniref:P-loop containing nucleoside triphosphate hydrolase protein n=1 Tax=Mycena pura TaxID=153505 RepID=A0AAD6YJB5_9AGAR|nr:P-loop containing nucleoside triphosphate hydrolase protein [Mycena pura]
MSLTEIKDIDRRGATRKVPMVLLCLGYSRTGTASMRVALELLGYHETNHGFRVMMNPSDREMWTEAINAKFFGKGRLYGRAEWDQLLGHCMAVADVPHILFAEELVAAYPEAKVVLTIRDPDRWWASYSGTIAEMLRAPHGLHPWLVPRTLAKMRAFQHLVFRALFGTSSPTPEVAKACFVAHYDAVRRLVPRERLLEYHVGEGWSRLCVFLEKPVPEEPFPKLNDTPAYREYATRRNLGILRQTLRKYVAPAIVAVMAMLSSAFQLILISLCLTSTLAATDFDWQRLTADTKLNWTPCYSGFQCSRLQVPLDYNAAQSEFASIAIVRLPSTSPKSEYRGPILFNPGGPGGSGVDAIVGAGASFATIFGPEFDIVGFDTRGVSYSTPTISFFKTEADRRFLIPSAEIVIYPSLNASSNAVSKTWGDFSLLGQLALQSDTEHRLQHMSVCSLLPVRATPWPENTQES